MVGILKKVGTLEFPRYCLCFEMADVEEVTLVGFSDASLAAFGSALYARVQSKRGVEVNLIASKSRVAPLKTQSLPRLELLGCLSLAQLAKLVVSALS